MRRPRCGSRHAKWCNAYHAALMADYWAARDAVLALRESGQLVSPSHAAGADGAHVAAYSLEDDEFRRAFPLPRFKDWLATRAEEWREPA